MSDSKPHNAPFISQAVKENGYCGEVSESGEWVCVKDADHDGPHGDERWGAPELNQHSTLAPSQAIAALEDFVDQSRSSHQKKLAAARAISVLGGLEEQLEAAQTALREIVEMERERDIYREAEEMREIARAALSNPASRSGS